MVVFLNLRTTTIKLKLDGGGFISNFLIKKLNISKLSHCKFTLLIFLSLEVKKMVSVNTNIAALYLKICRSNNKSVKLSKDSQQD